MPKARDVSRAALMVLFVLGVMVGCRCAEREARPTVIVPQEAPPFETVAEEAAEPLEPAEAPEEAAPAKARPAEPVVLAPVEPAAKPAGWTLQFSDSFDRAELGGDWKGIGGTWRIENGMLSGGAPGAPTESSIVCAKKFPGSQRLEFDAVTNDPRPCDLSGLLCVDERGLLSGYFFGFGSEWNAFSKLLIQGSQAKQWDTVITAGKLHHVVCELDANTLKHIVDGKEVMTHTVDAPLTGEAHQMVGFYIYSIGKIDNVKVYTKTEK